MALTESGFLLTYLKHACRRWLLQFVVLIVQVYLDSVGYYGLCCSLSAVSWLDTRKRTATAQPGAGHGVQTRDCACAEERGSAMQIAGSESRVLT